MQTYLASRTAAVLRAPRNAIGAMAALAADYVEVPVQGPSDRVVRVLPITKFTTPSGPPGTNQIVVEKYVDVGPFTKGALVTRVHAISGAVVWTVIAQNATRTVEELATIFFTDNGETGSGLPTSLSPNLKVTALNTPLSELLRVLVEAPASASVSITISVDLVLRDR